MKNHTVRVVAAFLALSISFFSNPSYAVEYITGKVTMLESTYMPGFIILQMDTGNTTCPAGTLLKWQKDIENNKAVYSTLMAAQVSGRKINFIINNGDTTCTGVFLHLLDD